MGSSLKDLEPGQSHTIEEENYRTGEIKSRTTYTKDKFTGEIHKETIDYPNDPEKGAVVSKVRNSKFRNIVVFSLVVLMGAVGIMEFLKAKSIEIPFSFQKIILWLAVLVIFLLIAFMIWAKYLEYKAKSRRRKERNEKINWKATVGVNLPAFISMVVVLITVVGVVAVLIYLN